MLNGYKAAIALVAILACTSAGAQTSGRMPPVEYDADAGELPPATGASPRISIMEARQEIVSAAESLAGAKGVEEEISVTAAYQDTLEARAAMQQAMSAAKAEAVLQDEVSDHLHEAIDQISEVARSLDQMAPPVSEPDLDAALEHLGEVATRLDMILERLER